MKMKSFWTSSPCSAPFGFYNGASQKVVYRCFVTANQLCRLFVLRMVASCRMLLAS